MSPRGSALLPKTPTIKFGTQDVVHTYNPTSSGAATAVHERRDASRHDRSPLTTPRLLPVEEGESEQQSVSMYPQSLATNFEARGLKSAPPLAYNISTQLPQASDPFESSPATTIGSSFADSPHYDGYREEQDERDAAWKRSPAHRGRGHSSDRRYPLNAGEDDREESISLVNRPSLDDDYDDEVRGGIRLVAPSPRRG